jgi:enterochelin esterase family protein
MGFLEFLGHIAFPGILQNIADNDRAEIKEVAVTRRSLTCLVILAAVAFVPVPAAAQSGRGAGQQTPTVVSPEISAERRITFRIYAPKAEAIRLVAGDIPGVGQSTQLTKGETGVWETVVGPVDPGAYRYTFNVDGVSVVDPRNPHTSESNNSVWSMTYVPGSDVMDTRNVPHGAVAAVTYFSTALGMFRRMHVYTPPGYELRSERYPVFYLLHGAGDSDHAWTSVGRAGFILDNLIADNKAKPMIVVMPAGHTRRGPSTGRTGTEEFVKDFLTDVVPLVEKRYRILTGRSNTAIAGLSMGGNHTMHIAFPHLDKFGFIGVYSSGLLGAFPGLTGGRGAAPPTTAPTATPPVPPPAPPLLAADWVDLHKSKIDDPRLKKELKLLWFGTGETDSLMPTTIATVDLLKKHGFAPVFKQTPGGHTWINWRNYLQEFAPQLFR